MQAGQGGWKVPEGQQVSPDVEGLVGHLEKAEDAGSGGTLWVSVAKDDALLMEHLQGGEKGPRGEMGGCRGLRGNSSAAASSLTGCAPDA